MLKWTDIHAHLNMLEASPEEILEEAQKNGVERVITIGTCPDDLDIVLNLAKNYSPKVACSIGIHPHDAKHWTKEIAQKIENNLHLPYVVSLGEMGLDYYYNMSEKSEQITAFTEQLELAHKYNMPVQIHTRDAEQDTIDILKKFKGEIKGVIHCFTGTDYLAQECLKLGLDISISGISTFKNANELRDAIKNIPLERMHVETDSPFLAPVPKRGRKNQPAFVVHTAEHLAELMNISLENLCTIVQNNNLRTFPKLALLK